MLKFLDDRAILSSVIELIRKGDRADLAVAYWGKDATERLGLNTSRKTRIICDLLSGACNPNEIEKLRGQKNVDVRHLTDEHAKVYWTPAGMIVGSANASANGLGDQDDGTIEAAIWTNDQVALSEAATWFRDKWKGAKPVTDTLIEQGREAWKRRPPRPRSNETMLQKYVSEPEWFRERVLVTYYLSEASADAKRKFEEIKNEYYSQRELKNLGDEDYPFYDEHIADVPDHLIGNVVIDVVSRDIYSIFRIEPYSKDSCVVLLKPERNVLGLAFPPEQRRLLMKAIKQHLANKEQDLAWNLEDLPDEVNQYLLDNFTTTTKPIKRST